MSVGIRGGMNINYLGYQRERADPVYDTQSTIGFHYGVFLEGALPGNFSFRPEMLYSRRGFRYPSGRFGQYRTMNLNYIEGSLIIAYSIGKFAIDLGPTLSHQTSAKVVIDHNTRLIARWWRGNQFDHGITAGIRIQVLKELSAIARGHIGFVAVDEIQKVDHNNVVISTASGYNRNIQFGLAYKVLPRPE